MKKTPWAGLGALAVLLALPATAPAMGDEPSPVRARRMTVVNSESLATAPVALENAPLRRERLRLTEVISPALPSGPDPAPEALDVRVEASVGQMVEASDFHALDVPLTAPQLSSETRAAIRAEAACLFTLDLPVVR